MIRFVIGHTCPKACRRTRARVHLNPRAAIEDPRVIEIVGRVVTLSPEEHHLVVIRIKSHARKAPHRRAIGRCGERGKIMPVRAVPDPGVIQISEAKLQSRAPEDQHIAALGV